MTLGVAQFGQVPFGGTPTRGISRTFSPNYIGVESQMATSLWRLGEASSTYADSVAGVLGTATGSVLHVPGLVPGDADGAVQLVNSPGPDHIDFGSTYAGLFTGNGAFSIVAVVQPTALDANYRRIVTLETAANVGISLYAQQSYVGIIRGTSGAGYENCYLTAALSLVSPTHIVATYDEANLRLYLNGALVAGPMASARTLAALNPLRLGNPTWSATQGSQTVVDEFMVCTSALSQAQITALYTAYGARQVATVVANPGRGFGASAQSQTVTRAAMTVSRKPSLSQGQAVTKAALAAASATMSLTQGQALTRSTVLARVTTSLTQGQALTRSTVLARVIEACYYGVELPMASNLWRLGEASGSLADSAGAKTGTPHNTVNRVAGLVPGDNDGAVQIPNSSGGGDYIDCGQAALSLAVGTAPFSIVLVVQPSAVDGTYRRIISCETGANVGIWLYCTTGYTGFGRGTSGGSEDCHWSSSLVTTAPTHVVCTYDGTAMHIYINNVLRDTVASSRSLAAMNNLRVGNRGDGVNQGFKGTLDELMVCPFALTTAQIAALYAAYQQNQAVTCKATLAATRAPTQSQAVTATAALGRTMSAAGNQSLSVAGRWVGTARMTASQSAVVALRQSLSRLVAVTQAESVSPIGLGPTVATFALTQGAVVTHRGAITATRALAQDQEAKRLLALNVIIAQTAGAAFQRSVGRWLAKTQPQTATRRATVITTAVVTQAGAVGATGVVNAVKLKQTQSVVSQKRVVTRSLTKQQSTVLRVSRNTPRVKTATQVESLLSIRATARSTFIFANGQIVVLKGLLRILPITQSQTIVLRRGLTGTFAVAQDQTPIYKPRLKRGRITVTDRSPHAVATISSTRLATSVQGTRISVEVG